MKYILKNKIIAFLALLMFFSVPGLFSFQDFQSLTAPESFVQQAVGFRLNPLAVKSAPADFLGFLRQPAGIQKTENTTGFLQDVGVAVQNPMASDTYQAPGEFIGSIAAVLPISDRLQVKPLKLAAYKVVVPAATNYFDNFSVGSSAPITEKAVLVASATVVGLKNSNGSDERARRELRGKKLTPSDSLLRESSIIFRC